MSVVRAFNQPKDPNAQIITVTPDIARRWLDKSLGNRTLRRTKVAQFGRSMVGGDWHLTGQAIQFDSNGRLIDGHHRLTAVVESGATVQFLVVTGVNPDALAVIDTGTARTPGDMLAVLDGVKNAHLVGAIAARAVAWDAGFRWFGNYKATHEEIRRYVSDPQNYFLIDAASVARAARQSIPVRATLFGLSYFLCARVNRPQADDFFVSQLINAIGLSVGDPAHTLMRRLAADAHKGGPRADFEKLALIITAWNHYRAGNRVTKMQAPKGSGWTHGNFPEPQ